MVDSLVGMMRVKNEARWIGRVVASILPVCRAVYVMDDGSDDDTATLAEAAGAVTWPSPFEGLDEVRDKNWLLDRVVREASPGWILCVDGDEELHAADRGKVAEAVKVDGLDCYSLRILYLWDAEDRIRVDGGYGKFRRASLFRAIPGDRFASRSKNGFHCSNAPRAARYRMGRSAARLLHYGYIDRETRMRKFEWYSRVDPNNGAEDGYRHMVIGDKFPADSRFRHGGPLKLEPLAR